MLQIIANWFSIFAFVITVFTLLMTLNIRSKIERSLGKQRFLQQRGRIVADFQALRSKIKCQNGDAADGESLEELRVLLLSLTHYRIWRLKDRLYLKQFIGFASKVYSGEKQSNCKDLVMRIDEVVAIVKSQVEV